MIVNNSIEFEYKEKKLKKTKKLLIDGDKNQEEKKIRTIESIAKIQKIFDCDVYLNDISNTNNS